MYQPTSRVLTVLELLQSYAQISGAELAERLEVDRRTVRRYILQLQDLGIPVEAERGRYGAYRLRPGYKLPPLMFSNDEAIALTLGLLTVKQLRLESVNVAVEGALAKLLRVMPQELRERSQALQDTLVVDSKLAESQNVAHGVVAALSVAIHQQQSVYMNYQSYDGQPSERRFDPYGLVIRKGRWYSVGYCHLREDLRTFRLDRMGEITLLDEPFMRPEGFDPLATLERSLAQVPREFPVRVLLQGTLDEIQAKLPVTLGIFTSTQQGIVLQGYVENLRWLALLLLDLAVPLEIQAPRQLIDEFQRLQAQIQQILIRDPHHINGRSPLS